jgi:hypothetical protein
MLNIKLFGDRQNEKFTWMIMVVDSRGTTAECDGVANSEEDAKAHMLKALGKLLEKLEFKRVGDDKDDEHETS